MAGSAQGTGALVERLQARRGEIEQTLLTRVYAVSDPREVGDSEYVLGLREAVSAALDYGLAVLAEDESPLREIPREVLIQARNAARSGVSLGTVLRRSFSGYSLLGDFLLREIESEGRAIDLKRLTRLQAAAFDKLMDAIASEYRSALAEQSRPAGRRQALCVERLLRGELVDQDLEYDLQAWHLGMVAKGRGFQEFVRDRARSTGCRLLFVMRDDDVAWAWLGARSQISANELAATTRRGTASEFVLSLGEPGHGLGGWRLTHQQAEAAFSVASRRPGELVRYTDVCLLTAILQDEVLVRSLDELYLSPLRKSRGGGRALIDTLRAYFDANSNISSTAGALGVSRQTVTNRILTVEQRLGTSLSNSAREIEAALHLAELDEY